MILAINDDTVIVTIVFGSRDRVILVFCFGWKDLVGWSGWEFNTVRYSNLWAPHSII